MTEPVKPFSLRDAMPLTAEWVDQQREKLGERYVNDCIRRSLKGERNQFYAIEAGHILGTQFDWTVKGAHLVAMSVLTGAKFIAALRDPADVVQMVIESEGHRRG